MASCSAYVACMAFELEISIELNCVLAFSLNYFSSVISLGPGVNVEPFFFFRPFYVGVKKKKQCLRHRQYHFDGRSTILTDGLQRCWSSTVCGKIESFSLAPSAAGLKNFPFDSRAQNATFLAAA